MQAYSINGALCAIACIVEKIEYNYFNMLI